MRIYKQAFDFYINSSIHVGLSCYALVRMTQYLFYIPDQASVANFAFFGTIVAYNFVKYEALARTKKNQMRKELKLIAVFSFCSFIMVGYYFFLLHYSAQIVAVSFLGITVVYAFPFFPNKRNARNWSGIKIYIVALCWVGVTLGLPVLNAEIPISFDFYLKCIQRFILVFALLLVFEIIDLSNDDPHLHTVPQKIGIKRTKILAVLLMFVFYFLEFFKNNLDKKQLIINLILVFLIAFFVFYATDKRSKYYTSFWVESIPIFWWLLVLFYCFF